MRRGLPWWLTLVTGGLCIFQSFAANHLADFQGTPTFVHHYRRASKRVSIVGSLLRNAEQADQADLELVGPKRPNGPHNRRLGRISKIRCRNLAGVSGTDGKDLVLDFDSSETSSNLVAVTGETGHGKSLLVSKVADLVTGGKATASLLHSPEVGASADIEITLELEDEMHISMVKNGLQMMKLDIGGMFDTTGCGPPLLLRLKRSLGVSESSKRMKSTCYINDQLVPLKALKAIGAPLLAVVNAPLAASALGKGLSRMALIDAGVSSEIISEARHRRKDYNKCRKERERLEEELEKRTLPVSMSIDRDDEKDVELLRHWIEELDGFETRMMELSQSVQPERLEGESQLGVILEHIDGASWVDNDSPRGGFSSTLYRLLLDLSDYLRTMDDKIEATVKARETLGSLSMPDSAQTALERSRQLLLDVGYESTDQDESKLMVATEHAHELLNQVEMALVECASFLDDDDNGLLAVLQNERKACQLSSENLLEYLTEWSTMARKHGISPYLLPSCHSSLRQELDGNVEARTLLPKALAAEEQALEELQVSCERLTEARSHLASQLSESISQRLPSLGMNARFDARVRRLENPLYGSSTGVEEMDFFLYHFGSTGQDHGSASDSKGRRGGKLELIASSGERARILLAMGCEIPGSIRALCGTSAFDDELLDSPGLTPVAVIYDEIDAHVGGRASVSVAGMLSEQSRACQVVSITHSPSVAAMADAHICIQKCFTNGTIEVSAQMVKGSSRLKELARMASGDMASQEAEAFAEALIRETAANQQASSF